MATDTEATSARRPHPLKGPPTEPSTPQPKVGGWHGVEWACEFAGTAFQLFVGFGAVALFEATGSPVRRAISYGWLRLVLIGVAFGLLAAAVAISPVGKRSGAHLNPAVTAGFWARGHTHPHDLLGYALAQTLGALAAAAAFAACWGKWSREVNDARTMPGAHVPLWGAAMIEAGLTFGLLMVIFIMVSSQRTARFTPLVVTGALSGLIWAGAPFTGASMNPSRTFGPDVVGATFPALWVYLVGPPIGALLAAGVYTAASRQHRTLTAKLFHDPRYPTTQRTDLPAKPHPSTYRKQQRERAAAEVID